MGGCKMAVARASALKDYLGSLHGRTVKIVHFEELGMTRKERPVARLKGFGFGTPYLIEYKVAGKTMSGVFNSMRPGEFGHDFPCDRAHSLLLAHSTFNRLPRHARSLDVGILTKKGELKSIGDFKEFFIFLEKVEGVGYYKDLARIRDSGALTEADLSRCTALSNYIARVHAVKKDSPDLYVRRMRDLVGHGECIMGLIDSYPTGLEFVDENELQWIEKRCVEWRWKLKDKFHRLSRVHGDFHPFNIMFRKGTDFTALDRSRGEWGEPADDVAAMSINYLLFSLQARGDLSGPLEQLYELFMESYLNKTADDEMLEVIQPFYAWRSLVIANPIWYPTLSTDRRRKLFNFIRSVLESERFDIKAVNNYMA
jgi:hypothetical protein